jgi:hypothetical protein
MAIPRTCSGAAYRAVPKTAPEGSVHAASASARAKPKSAMRRRPSSSKIPELDPRVVVALASRPDDGVDLELAAVF